MLGAKLGGGRRKRGVAAAVALFASGLACLAGIHGAAAGKASMAPHPHQGKVKVGCYHVLCFFCSVALFRVLLYTDVFYIRTHVY